MYHPLFSSEIARERTARYRADAGRRRLARSTRSARRRVPLAARTGGERD